MSPAFTEVRELDDIYKSIYPKIVAFKSPMKAKSLRKSSKYTN